MIFFVLGTLTLIYLFSIPKVRSAKFGRPIALTFRIVILTATPILIALLVAETYNIYPNQYWLTKGVFWLVVFSCMSAYGLCRKDYFGCVERRIYKIVYYLPLVLVVFLFAPVIGIAYGLLFYTKFVGDTKFILYHDASVRIEQPNVRFLGPNPQPVVYVKKTLTAFKDTVLPFGYDADEDKLEVTKLDASSYMIIWKSPNIRGVPMGSDTFFYQLPNHRQH